jgi:hypothetical protein
VGDEFWWEKGEVVACEGWGENGVEGAEDREGRVTEESKEDVGLERMWEARKVIEERWQGEQGSESEIWLERG